MLDRDVVIQPVHFVPGDVKRKTLQPSTLQQEDTVINMFKWSDSLLMCCCILLWHSHQQMMMMMLTCNPVSFILFPAQCHICWQAEETNVLIFKSSYSPSVDYSECCRWRGNRKAFMFRIQALQCSSALRWVLRTAKCPAACQRFSSLCLWCKALLHLFQNILTRRRWHTCWARAKRKRNCSLKMWTSI